MGVISADTPQWFLSAFARTCHGVGATALEPHGAAAWEESARQNLDAEVQRLAKERRILATQTPKGPAPSA